MKLQKTISKSRALFMIAFGYLVALGLIVSGFQTGLTEEANSFGAIAIFLILILGFLGAGEVGIANFKQASKIKDEDVKMNRDGSSADVAKIGAGIAKWTAIPFLVLSVLWVGFVLAVPSFLLPWGFAPNLLGFAGLIGAFAHFTVLKRFVYPGAIAKLKTWQEKNVTQVQVVSDGLEITPMETVNTIGKKPPTLKPISIGFHEVTEMKLMNLAEIMSFGQYAVGPDVKMAAQSKIDLFKYMQGKLVRPSAYLQITNNPSMTFLLIQGENLLYAFTAKEDDAKAAVEAWQRQQ